MSPEVPAAVWGWAGPLGLPGCGTTHSFLLGQLLLEEDLLPQWAWAAAPMFPLPKHSWMLA